MTVLCRHCREPISNEEHVAGWWEHTGRRRTASVLCWPGEPRPGRGSLMAEPGLPERARRGPLVRLARAVLALYGNDEEKERYG